MSTGIEFEWERKAIRGDELPDDLGYPEQVLYLELRMLYEQYRNKIIDRDAATREKNVCWMSTGFTAIGERWRKGGLKSSA